MGEGRFWPRNKGIDFSTSGARPSDCGMALVKCNLGTKFCYTWKLIVIPWNTYTLVTYSYLFSFFRVKKTYERRNDVMS